MNDSLNILLNGKIVNGIQGETILDLANRYQVEIPTLCNDPRLEPYSSCFICVVEVAGLRGLQPACSTRVYEGMKINTDTPRIRKARKTALDLMVSNHYADCVAPCKETCPAGVDVQGYISLIEKGLYSEAVGLIKEVNPLPAICGRVCVRPCEAACRRNLLDEGTGVGIDYLKRFASDIDLESPDRYIPEVEASTGKKVAIIGAGPGGLSSAYFLQQKGHQCDIYEAGPKPGGWLRYGIPEYRLPNDIIDKEVAAVTELGARIFYNRKLGDDLSYNEIKERYDATILTIGSQRGTLIGCEGDDAGNVFSGIDFLRNMEMTGQKYDFSGKTVAVVGGGNTAMDCCRTSMRCNAKKVYVIYRRTEKEMPANPIEIHESKLEGVEYLFLTNPKKVNKDANGDVKSITCLKMELGAPDSSGRRRPVPVEGSDYDLDVDYIMAAIGQKTHVNFLEDVNALANGDQLKLNRWGDIDANRETLQTGIPSMFAAGDGVTGPATIIEAIAQAKTASRSCHQFLSGEVVVAEKKEFISRRDHFHDQDPKDYVQRYQKQLRHEMPTMDPANRKNFEEVELGYENEEVALAETQRCLECGCSEYFTCKLKEYSTEYEAEQQKYEGRHVEYAVDFSHPFIEIDNNKCILCARCVRICKEVVGASALGLVQRGFDTYVAPSMGSSLNDTPCESCGLCISACPTGAITENVLFKPGPVKTEAIQVIDNYGSEGFEMELHHKGGFFMRATGVQGEINKEGNISRQAKFGYNYLNDPGRITTPLLKKNGEFQEISFEEAFGHITDRIKDVEPDANAFFAGARLTNEEIYLVQKLARAGAKTNNVNCFHYMGRGIGYGQNASANVPFEDIKKASRIFILANNLNYDHPLVNHEIFSARNRYKVPVELVCNDCDNSMIHKVDKVHQIKDFYYFVKAVNYYLLTSGLQNQLFINDRALGFEEYKARLMSEDFDDLFEKSGVCCIDEMVQFAKDFNNEQNAVLVFSEKEMSSNVSFELFNLAIITGKLGKTAQGLIALKEKNNSQGVIDMGGCHKVAPGFQPYDDKSVINKLKQKWGISDIPENINSPYKLLKRGELINMFVFGEDPLGCAVNRAEVEEWFNKIDFVMVQDYFMTETALQADLILPASLPFEIGGSFTTTQKRIQKFEKQIESALEIDSPQQLSTLLTKLGVPGFTDMEEVLWEVFSLLPPPVNPERRKFSLHYTAHENYNRMFAHGCDIINKRFDDEFEVSF
jgi:formate dehydrogenase major subunit